MPAALILQLVQILAPALASLAKALLDLLTAKIEEWATATEGKKLDYELAVHLVSAVAERGELIDAYGTRFSWSPTTADLTKALAQLLCA